MIRGRFRIPLRSSMFAVLIALVACAGEHPEEQLAAAVRDQYSDVIVRVETREGNFVDPALVRFVVRPGTSREVVRRIACSSSQEAARSLRIEESMYVEAETEDGLISEGGTTLGCEPAS